MRTRPIAVALLLAVTTALSGCSVSTISASAGESQNPALSLIADNEAVAQLSVVQSDPLLGVEDTTYVVSLKESVQSTEVVAHAEEMLRTVAWSDLDEQPWVIVFRWNNVEFGMSQAAYNQDFRNAVTPPNPTLATTPPPVAPAVVDPALPPPPKVTNPERRAGKNPPRDSLANQFEIARTLGRQPNIETVRILDGLRGEVTLTVINHSNLEDAHQRTLRTLTSLDWKFREDFALTLQAIKRNSAGVLSDPYLTVTSSLAPSIVRLEEPITKYIPFPAVPFAMYENVRANSILMEAAFIESRWLGHRIQIIASGMDARDKRIEITNTLRAGHPESQYVDITVDFEN